MKKLTKKQIDLVEKIKHLTGMSFSTKPIKRSALLIELPVDQRTGESIFEKQIQNVVDQYRLGRIEPNGVNYIALITD